MEHGGCGDTTLYNISMDATVCCTVVLPIARNRRGQKGQRNTPRINSKDALLSSAIQTTLTYWDVLID